MKFFLAAIVAACFFLRVSGQQESFRDVPGLLHKLSTASTDTGRIMIKCSLAEAYRSNKPDSSLLLANEALSASKKAGFKKGEIHAWIVLCVLAREKGDLPYALELGLKALKMAEEEKLAYEQVSGLIRVAVVYMTVKDIPKSIEYLKKAESVLKNNYDDFQWTAVQFFLGDAYDQLNDLEAAEKQVKIIEQRQASNYTWIIISSRMRASIAVKRNDLPLAITYYRKSNEVAMAESEFREAATASNAMALTFRKMGQTDSAIFYAKQGLRLGQMLSYRNRILAASSLLAELYADTDPAQAVQYYKIASASKDSLYGIQKVLQLQSSTIKEQERQTELEAARLAYQNKVRQWALLGGIAVILFIALLLYRNNRQKQKANKILETALTNLRTTQAQLVHAEKMASLGELTAGIAHEIQNPLNFVNNFSEVNKELAEELKTELSAGNRQSAMEIAGDIKENSARINHHGRRADAIVKNMLLHSGSGGGQKEPTDINSLCDEYARLCYHGLRAKDKSFNARIETSLDPLVRKINIVPQDIGRVLLNLINNAFYAVSEKQSRDGSSCQPVVSISTKKINDSVEIRIKDNGTGIPPKVKDKIFQPFFTTKPTGQGTGLGLSLSYDIIKAHGGDIRVDTKENEWTEFIIRLAAIEG